MTRTLWYCPFVEPGMTCSATTIAVEHKNILDNMRTFAMNRSVGSTASMAPLVAHATFPMNRICAHANVFHTERVWDRGDARWFPESLHRSQLENTNRLAALVSVHEFVLVSGAAGYGVVLREWFPAWLS